MDKKIQGILTDYNVPKKLRNAVTEICVKHNINGTSDPGYISNVIAYELGIGDGQGNFQGDLIKGDFEKIANRLSGSYGSCGVTKEEVINILTRNL